MATFTFKIYGRNVKFKAASTMQARFARDKHVECLRAQARERARNRKADKVMEQLVTQDINARVLAAQRQH